MTSGIENPLAPELATLKKTTTAACDGFSGDSIGNVPVDVHVE